MMFKDMKNKISGYLFSLLVIFLIGCSSCSTGDVLTLDSPNGKYQFELFTTNNGEALQYRLIYDEVMIIKDSKLGMRLSNSDVNYTLGEFNISEVSSEWETLYGERKLIPENYKTLSVSVLENGEQAFVLQVRAYNEGVAFRYEYSNDSDLIVADEMTQFDVDNDATAWVSVKSQGAILKKKIKDCNGIYNRPLLMQYSDTLFVALGEAANVDFARMNFAVQNAEEGILKANLTQFVVGEEKLGAHAIRIKAGEYNTPWRFIMVGETAGEIVENNYLVLNLNDANEIEDTSWIKPGKVIREVTLTTVGGKACVDFAVKNNLQYIEFDAGWYGHEYDEKEDATTVTVDPDRSPGPLDLPGVVDYANSKGIGVILYVNRRAMEKQLDDVLDFVSEMGVKGLKYGFVRTGPQRWTDWLHEAVRKAADHKLMVDIHDEYRPTGYSRTYPNLMTQEGIRGDEESPANAMVLNTVFTRMIAGAGDQTNCYFAERVDEKMGSHVSQMVKTICIYSPWQFLFWYDRPLASPTKKGDAGDSTGRILDLEDLSFYRQVPTTWDETRVIEGYPGEYVIMARRSGEDWFVAVLNGNTSRDVEINLDFLKDGQEYECTTFSDDKAVNTITNVSIKKSAVTSGDHLSAHVNKSNGFVAILKHAK